MIYQGLIDKIVLQGTLMNFSQMFFYIATSKLAIIIYVIILFTIMMFFVANLMIGDFKKKSSNTPANLVIRQVTSTPSTSNISSSPKKEAEEVEEGEKGIRFCMLNRIDENKAKYEQSVFDKEINLKKFCDNFRNYAASELKLYYDIKDIRRFVSGMAVSPILILQGMSGTGKTSLAHAMGVFLGNPSTIIPVQPIWKERTDLLGYYNEFTKRFNETLLLEKIYEANYSKEIYITVLDEMNIARVEYYFAEFLSLLELTNPEERYIDVVSDVWEKDPVQFKDGRLKLPTNMWFIGTANNDDSTFAISDKVYDRAMILNLDEKSERFIAPKTKPMKLSAEEFYHLKEEAIKEYDVTKRNLKRLEELDRYLIDHFHITFGNRIMKQIRQYIPVYVSCGGGELEALDDILSKKIIRKLESQNPVYLRNEAEGLCVYLDELFGQDKMPLCKNAIHILERNA
jgi:MoxR-like ATPase